MDVSIIIVNYNTKELISNCIASIISQTSKLIYEIIVVDNASTDGSQDFFNDRYTDVKFIELPKNIGFGGANNVGFEHSVGEYLFFLNSDTILLNNAIRFFHDFMIKNKGEKIGCLGALLMDEKLNINGYGGAFPNLKNHFKSYFTLLNSKHDTSINLHSPFDVDYVLGADMFIPAKVFSNVGAFDPKYFMYYEESDLQLRIDTLGYSRKVIPEPKIIHLEGRSLNHSIKKMLIVRESAFRFFKKNRPTIEYFSFRVLSFLTSFLLLFKSAYSFKDFLIYLGSSFNKINLR
ncbi:MAG: glycosyltransferase family 2 protein [Pedobacter sp.]